MHSCNTLTFKQFKSPAPALLVADVVCTPAETLTLRLGGSTSGLDAPARHPRERASAVQTALSSNEKNEDLMLQGLLDGGGDW